jgi:cytidylate kinase
MRAIRAERSLRCAQPADALLLDTSDLSLDQAIAEALRLAEERLARAES